MIVTIRHKGLRLLYERGDRSKVRPDIVSKSKRVLTALNVAEIPQDIDLPGLGLHELKGDRKGYWSVTVSRNFRIVFRFTKGHVHDVDLVDYH